MRSIKQYILVLAILTTAVACNTEENLIPASQDAFIKIIKGQGSEVPLKIEKLSDQNLLVVSNTSIFQQTSTNEKIRVLKLDLAGNEVSDPKYFPEETNQNWSAADAIVTADNNIVIGGTVGDTSLIFFSLNSNLQIVDTQHYKLENAISYELKGFYFDESTNKIIFSGSEIQGDEEGGEQLGYTIYGELDSNDLSLLNVFRSEKAKELPATILYRDLNDRINWVYNSSSSTFLRSNTPQLSLIEELGFLEFKGATSITTRKLIGTNEGIVLFGEFDISKQTQLFYSKAYTSEFTPFGDKGNHQLNNVKKIESGYLVTGKTEILEEGANSQSDFLISRRGLNGGEVFTETFGSNSDEQLHDAVMVNNKIYAIGSSIIGINNTLLLLKMDEFGRVSN
ncbi:hypothetical protein [Marivirga harenae]|uniref:hypothetical protein n=1 Tax=Marivirga harenae TaxID=2010992 RepID=UPI0026DFA3C7|nr:hypothetical protein [Marivirga harenae]WKV13147.1 hypothetical protein Q3Y49_04815 [Marivirga harenae]|tara:strand:- start:302973 stop:304160 length:1188 start_codon:yes stop_codon:yes gene_type:complete